MDPTTSAASNARSELEEATKRAYDLVQEYASTTPPLHDAIVDNSSNNNNNNSKNPWSYPNEMTENLQHARNDLMQAWEHVQQEFETMADTDNNRYGEQEIEEEQEGEFSNTNNHDKNEATTTTAAMMKTLFMEMMTEEYEKELESLHEQQQQQQQQQDNTSMLAATTTATNVEIIVDCLKSGMDLLSPNEQELFLQPSKITQQQQQQQQQQQEGKAEKTNQGRQQNNSSWNKFLTPHEQNRQNKGFLIES